MLNPLTHRKVLKKGTPGRATIVERGALDRGGTSFNLPMTLQVHVEGITPYEVEDQWMVKAKDTVALDGSIPIKVDPSDHEKVAIDWETLRAEYEQEVAARREALAAGGPAGATINVGEPQVIDANANPEVMEQVSQMLGQMGINVQGQPAGGTGFASDGAGSDTDDQLGQLERLAALRSSGALTDEEFEEQKRRILGG
jgi:Short C-terminal domain